MKKGFAAQHNIFLQVMLLLLLIAVLTVLALALWGIIFIPIGQTNSIWSLRTMQLLQTCGTFLLPALLFAFCVSEQPSHFLHTNTFVSAKVVISAVLLMICILPAINLLSYLNQQLTLPNFLSDIEQWMQSREDAAAALTEQFIKADNLLMLLFNILLMALLPALSEEMLFRGVLQQLPELHYNKQQQQPVQARVNHTAIWASAILFSAIHLQFYGFFPRMLMGVLFGYMLVWTGSIWIPILMHFTNNLCAVLLYNLFYMQNKTTDTIDSLGTGDTLWLGIVSLILGLAGIWFIRRLILQENK